MTTISFSRLVWFVLLMMTAGSVLAQDGKLKMNVFPPETYVFVDGKAMGEASHPLLLSPGHHQIALYNYGFKPITKDLTISSGATTKLVERLDRITDMVSGPLGAVTIEGANRDAILLNGKTADFYIGHGDEFNHHWWWKQELIVPAGTHTVTVVRQGNEIWSGEVEVPADRRVVIDVPKGVRKTIPWQRGQENSPWPRFESGVANTSVAVAKPTVQLSAQNEAVKCGESTSLNWSSKDAARIEITPMGVVANSGLESVRPLTTTRYELKASGAGGTVASDTTITVDKTVQAQLSLQQPEIRYKRIGDKVLERGSTVLNWSAANADAVTIDPLGIVESSGSRTLESQPQRTEDGPVNETISYTLTATNACGGSETRSATLHITGSIESELAMHSIYFPTDLPKPSNMQAGLLPSQKQQLRQIADGFKKHLVGTPEARLVLFGHADERGTEVYNHALSERRADVAKLFLVQQGVPEGNIETFAYGEKQNLSMEEVKQLVENNSDLNVTERQKVFENMRTMVYAHNRRVDISLSTTGNESARHYPFVADDYASLVKRGPGSTPPVVLAAEREKM